VVTIAKGEAGSKACQSERWQQKAIHAITCTQAHLLRGELLPPATVQASQDDERKLSIALLLKAWVAAAVHQR
jgi:hypothetical protein